MEVLIQQHWILEISLAVCISLYGINTVLSFAFAVPSVAKYDDILVPYCAQNYTFRLLTSMIFFLYGIFLLTNIWLVSLMFAELIVLLIVFVAFLTKKLRFIKKKQSQIKEHKRRKKFSFFR
jgi:hypothetical protein